MAAFGAFSAASYDFDGAWSAVEEAQRRNLPRTVTNKVEEILREATSAQRWPDAARAFLLREGAMKELEAGLAEDWLPAFAASVDAQPAPLQAILQLHLAHTYLDNSNRRRWFGKGTTKLDDAAAAEKMPPWSPERINATLEAQFRKVLAHAEELKAMEVSGWTAIFREGTFPASYCPTLYDFAVRDMIDFYGAHIPDGTLEKGLGLYDALIEFHRTDGNLDARAMAEVDRAYHMRTFGALPYRERESQFVQALDDIMARFDGDSEVVAYAAWHKATAIQCSDDLVAAHKIASRYARMWPESPGGKLCANLVADIEAKEIELAVERNWCAPWPEIEVDARNVDEVHFRMVPVTFDDLVDDTSMGCYDNSRAESVRKEKYLKRKAAKEWSERLDLKPTFLSQQFRFAVPSDLKPGHYILFAATNDRFGADGLPLYSQNVTVTPLALVLEAGNGKFEGSVHFAESGRPVEGARVELWWHPMTLMATRRNALRETYETDVEGRFAADVSKGDDNGVLTRHVRVVKDGFEVLSLDSAGSGRKSGTERNYEHVDLFTDRALYRPGQEIHVKGIACHADPHLSYFHTHQFAKVLLTLSDPNGKEVCRRQLRTNRWGSFAETFVAPTDRLTGSYRITVHVDIGNNGWAEGAAEVNVEEYKRPKFKVEFDPAPDNAMLGKPVTLTGKAFAYSGLPVRNGTVEWEVERQTRYPGWWTWCGYEVDDFDGYVASGTAATDENGIFKVSFTPVASPAADLSGDPSFRFSANASVTDETGETRSCAASFEIGTVAWRAGVAVDNAWTVPGRPVAVHAKVETLAGTPVPFIGTLKVFRLKSPERPVRAPAGHGKYGWSPRQKGPWNWGDWEPGEEVMSVEASSLTSDGWEKGVSLEVGAYRLQLEVKDPSGKTVKDMANVCVFDPNAASPGIPVPCLFRTEKTTVKAGETLRAYWGTGYPDGWCRVAVLHNGKALVEKAVDATHWLFELPLNEEHRGEIRIETTFLRENRIYRNHATVTVPWDNKDLRIEAESFRSKLNPGGRETWKFKVSGPAEVLALMYDRSLDAYRRHDIDLGFSRYFTPSTPYVRFPAIQNGSMQAQKLSGKFEAEAFDVDFFMPQWQDFRVRYGAMRMNKMMLSCEGASAEACDDMVCNSSPAVKSCAPAKNKGESPDGNAEDVPLRKNMQETAFFLPALETDANGVVAIEFTVPDSLTGWKLLMVAHDNDLNGGVFRDETIVTTKPLMCEPNPPRFVREGDEFLFPVKVTNTQDVPQKGKVSLDAGIGCLTPDQQFDLGPRESRTFAFRLAVPDGCGYFRFAAKARGDGFSDGEEGVLPVLSRRVLVREAVQLNVRGRETKRFRLDNLLASGGSETIRHQDLTVRAVSRPAWYAVLSLPYLMEFPHECCEQTFSRYYANALGELVAKTDPRIRETFDAWKASGAQALKSPIESDPHLKAIALEMTPWVRDAEHENAARARLGELFSADRLSSEQARCVEKLGKDRNGDGLWPWFPGGPSSSGISLYILAGFARLNSLASVEFPGFFADAVKSLDACVHEDVVRRLKREKEDGIEFGIGGFDIRWMYLHSFGGVPAAANEDDARLFSERIAKVWPSLDLESQALAAIVLKRRGDENAANEIMASIKERAIVSDELGMYWKRPDSFSCDVFSAPVSTQALVAEAFREVSADMASVDACNVWLLKQKQTQDWTTTAATADAVYALMLGGGSDLLAVDALAEVSLGGEKVPTENGEPGTGMYSWRYAADEVSSKMGDIAFTGVSENGVAWGGVHWSYFEDVLKVRAHEPRELRVEKKYYRKVSGKDGVRLAAIEGPLEPGDEIVARIEICSDRRYEFVHICDERPSCAEPVDVLSSYRWSDGVGYYQSTRDAATHYYIDRLDKGRFVLETSFRVQQRGTFSSGMATIQCMYAPEFTGHSTAETITVR